jgi:hypothetical protein
VARSARGGSDPGVDWGRAPRDGGARRASHDAELVGDPRQLETTTLDRARQPLTTRRRLNRRPGLAATRRLTNVLRIGARLPDAQLLRSPVGGCADRQDPRVAQGRGFAASTMASIHRAMPLEYGAGHGEPERRASYCTEQSGCCPPGLACERDATVRPAPERGRLRRPARQRRRPGRVCVAQSLARVHVPLAVRGRHSGDHRGDGVVSTCARCPRRARPSHARPLPARGRDRCVGGVHRGDVTAPKGAWREHPSEEGHDHLCRTHHGLVVLHGAQPVGTERSRMRRGSRSATRGLPGERCRVVRRRLDGQ